MWEDLHKLSNMFANTLTELGLEREDRVGVSLQQAKNEQHWRAVETHLTHLQILLGQVPEAAISHITVYKMGCIAVPLFTAFGPDAIGK
jgi:acetyl-CoA synthetase